MRKIRLYIPAPLGAGQQLELDALRTNYLSRTLRLKQGAEFVAFNGEGGEYQAKLVELGRRSASIDIGEFSDIERESGLAITLVQGIGGLEKMDLVVQKATELGVAAIQPVATRRSQGRDITERAEKRVSRWESIAISAAEQCGRNRLLKISSPCSLADWLASNMLQTFAFTPVAAHDSWPTEPAAAVALVVGPEGGFDAEELATLDQSGAKQLSLGPRTLRTETAAITVAAAWQACFGDIGGQGHSR